jgi:hypothetical protein
MDMLSTVSEDRLQKDGQLLPPHELIALKSAEMRLFRRTECEGINISSSTNVFL